MKKGLILFIFLLNISVVFGEELDGFTKYLIKKGDALANIAPPEYWEIILKINKIDERHLIPGKTILIPKDLKRAFNFCPVPKRVTNFSERTVYVFLGIQYFGAYKKGELVFWGPISSGKKGFETPTGEFKVLWKSKNYFSKKYKVSMPFAICFSEKGYFLHEQSLPGKPASHGCVRLLKKDAERLFEWLQKGDLIIINNNSTIRTLELESPF